MRTPALKPVTSLGGQPQPSSQLPGLGRPTCPARSGQGSPGGGETGQKGQRTGPSPSRERLTRCLPVALSFCPFRPPAALFRSHLSPLGGASISGSTKVHVQTSGQAHAVLDGSWQWTDAWAGSIITALSRGGRGGGRGGRQSALSPPLARGSRCAWGPQTEPCRIGAWH